nr:uncharacterized protein LOC112941872 [Solanum lycopersicum]XP_025887996.1 uncharacterized protein LOC112941873 [Solanum lycopersicum]XP_025887997.1 uncharacterized protein LOC112941874 [Solanum lycopersicum]
MSCHELNEQNEADDDEFENQHKLNLEEKETVNLGDSECVKEVKISTHLNETQKESLVHLLTEYSDVFVWEVSDMQGLSTDVVSHKLPINPGFEPVKQKTRKFKPELNLKIKEEITKQIESRLVEVTQYPTWVMPFGLKNAGATYMRGMTTIFHDMIHKEIEVYMDDVIIKSRESSDYLTQLRKFFERLRRYNLKLNPAKCAFGVSAGKLLGFIVSRRVIELDPSKIKAIQELPLPKMRKEVMSFLGRLNYISGFIAQSIVHDETGMKEKAIYYISKKFTPYESRMDPLKYIFQKAMSTEKLAKWQMLLGEFDIVYVNQNAIKAQVLADYLAENPIDEELFFEGAANHQGKGVGAVLVSESGQHYPMAAKLRFNCTNNMAEYEVVFLV